MDINWNIVAASAGFAGMLLLQPEPAFAQSTGYKLIVAYSEGGVTAVDYPTKARCETAREAVQSEARARIARSNANLAPGAILVQGPRVPDAFCIPG